ncbi:Transmembrane protein 35 [Trichoplax sp. H2]|uniref:Transmembrane protein 35A n=1 Tax=Trichoplax adhaerens TaxID=10228 RepID=B3S9L1_TRIAD|nr:hypothetical protein TRIADDRAFT_60946 [Trichoplax adhaerens]EDV20493.1 hypothetical protein TRIADDRAFT_60946 [Trichoplax adhaerens]RDD41876.1 Transmembrane protein 35 [Trichoplax sp. H2]|eukprot:XP_002116919.1 hypothetical protein TRIADDRAFT_60946 [Trichoplax adhaerens]
MAVFKWLLRTILAGAFILGGAVKLMPTIHEEAYQHMDKAFAQFFDFLPFERISYPTSHKQLLQVTGMTEVACGTFMFIGPAFLRALSSMILMGIISAVMYSMHSLKHPQEHFIPVGVLFGLLFLERMFSGGSDSSSAKKQKYQ